MFSRQSYITHGLIAPAGGGADAPIIGLCLPEHGSTVGGGECVLYGGAFGAIEGSVTVGGVAAAVVAWSDVRVTITMPAGTAGAQTIALTTADAVTASLVNGFTFYPVSATDPILTRIEDSIEALIGALTVAGGYNFDHGVVNQEDRAHWDLAKVNHVVELEPEIECLDQSGVAFADRYAMRARFKAVSFVPISATAQIPKKAANSVLNMCLDDLQRVFGRDPDANNTCTVIQIESAERVDTGDGDRFYPKTLVTKWRVDYTQSRFNPEQFAN